MYKTCQIWTFERMANEIIEEQNRTEYNQVPDMFPDKNRFLADQKGQGLCCPCSGEHTWAGAPSAWPSRWWCCHSARAAGSPWVNSPVLGFHSPLLPQPGLLSSRPSFAAAHSVSQIWMHPKLASWTDASCSSLSETAPLASQACRNRPKLFTLFHPQIQVLAVSNWPVPLNISQILHVAMVLFHDLIMIYQDCCSSLYAGLCTTPPSTLPGRTSSDRATLFPICVSVFLTAVAPEKRTWSLEWEGDLLFITCLFMELDRLTVSMCF